MEIIKLKNSLFVAFAYSYFIFSSKILFILSDFELTNESSTDDQFEYLYC